MHRGRRRMAAAEEEGGGDVDGRAGRRRWSLWV
jgi:hypothetical protein